MGRQMSLENYESIWLAVRMTCEKRGNVKQAHRSCMKAWSEANMPRKKHRSPPGHLKDCVDCETGQALCTKHKLEFGDLDRVLPKGDKTMDKDKPAKPEKVQCDWCKKRYVEARLGHHQNKCPERPPDHPESVPASVPAAAENAATSPAPLFIINPDVSIHEKVEVAMALLKDVARELKGT